VTDVGAHRRDEVIELGFRGRDRGIRQIDARRSLAAELDGQDAGDRLTRGLA
jgi:hypothetical protein